MIADPNRLYDGFDNLAAGVDDGRKPNLIDKNQCALAENAVFRGGAPTNRPPFLDIELLFDNPNLTYNDNGTFLIAEGPTSQGQDEFETGVFQEASYFAPRKGQEYLMVSIGGRFYQITPAQTTAKVREIALDKRNRNTIPINYHLQAGIYHITQDGESLPIIFDGVIARRAGKDEIFTGRMMGYGQGRIVLIGTDNQIYFGDIRDGKGRGDTDLLGFTETQFLNEGFPSALPSGMGVPTAVQFLPAQDTATGVGECIVFGESGAESFFLGIQRELWKDSQFQRTALLGIGTGGHRSVAVVNQDLWFRPNDGYRSYRQARAQIDKWAQLPMSTNVSTWIKSDTPSLLEYASTISFDNRMIGTCSPIPNQGKLYHNGALALDFEILSTFGQVSDPAWDGHWSDYTADPLAGLKVLQFVEGVFSGERRAFAFVVNSEGHNSLIEISKVTAGEDTGGKITSRITLRSMDCESKMNEKSFYGGDVWIDDVADETVVTARYRPDQRPFFTNWYEFTRDAIGTPGEITPGMVPTLKLGYKPRRSLPKPFDNSDSNTSRILRRFYEFQAELKWVGRATIRKFRLQAQREIEDSKADDI